MHGYTYRYGTALWFNGRKFAHNSNPGMSILLSQPAHSVESYVKSLLSRTAASDSSSMERNRLNNSKLLLSHWKP